MAIAAALFFLLLPFIFHLVVTGTLISGLWIYFLGAIVVGAFIVNEATS